MKINKENIALWDMETTKLNDIAFQLSINNVNRINIDLKKRNREIRAAYTTQKDFVKEILVNRFYQEYIKKAKIILRRYKIEKLTKCMMK